MYRSGTKVVLLFLAHCFGGGAMFIVGCGGQPPGNGTTPQVADQAAAPQKKAVSTPKVSQNRTIPSRKARAAKGRKDPSRGRDSPNTTPAGSLPTDASAPVDLLIVDLTGPSTQEQRPPRPEINLDRASVAGIRKLSSKHLDLYTDLPPGAEVDELPHVFDLAVPQWCEYFHIEPAKVESWKMVGYIMGRKERFIAMEMLPDDLPPFLNGYQRGWEFWVYEQPSAYYRRHLLLHEGTHAFMSWNLGGCGPPWYMEGVAELLATHHWEGGQLQMNYFPRNREEVEQWGRIKIVSDDVKSGRALTLNEIAQYSSTAHLRIEPYGWSWAASAFLDGHPDYQRAFRTLASKVRDDSEFRQTLGELLQTPGRQLAEQWQLFVDRLDYGYDIGREAIVYGPARPLPAAGSSVPVVADRGWQSTGLELTAGVTYILEASGRYRIGREPKPWWCEPGGVTIEYYGGRPLGMLLAAVSDSSQTLAGTSPLIAPEAIGMGGTIRSQESGVLFLRINENPAKLADNAGELVVSVRPE